MELSNVVGTFEYEFAISLHFSIVTKPHDHKYPGNLTSGRTTKLMRKYINIYYIFKRKKLIYKPAIDTL
jgi:hypothetical protein